MKILVTGGAGFIGSHVVDDYVEAGHEVVVVDNLETGVEENLNKDAEFVQMDIRDDKLMDLVKDNKFEVINHHAAHINVGWSVERPDHDADVNIMGSLNLMRAAKESKTVKQIIFASTGGAMYGHKQTPFDEIMVPQPLSPYGISKRATELYLYFYNEQHGINFTSLRYANVYGPRQNPHGEAGVIAIFFNCLKSGKQPVINGDGKQTRDYVYVGDVANANLLALEKKVAGEFNIGTTIETDVNQIYSLCAHEAGSDVKADHGPDRPGEQLTSSLKFDKSKKALDWEPVTELSDGIKETAEYFLGEKK